MPDPIFTDKGVIEGNRLYVGRRQSGYVDGVHFTALVDTVRHLKRGGDLDGAERLLLRLIDANEAEAREMEWGVAPWYYEQLAIVYRKKKDLRHELAALERYQRQQRAPGARPAKLAERAQKVRLLLQRQESESQGGV